MCYDIPRIAVAALRGGAGKTILSIGLASAWKQSGKKVAPFKKGPDYIDAGWLAFATGRHCYNLDTYLCDPLLVRHSFFHNSRGADIAIIEGNRGLYDGIDLVADTSTADIAKLLDSPVLLCLDVTKSTKTMAALVLGCLHFDPDLNICGVILNRVAGARHAAILTKAIEYHTGVPVLGVIPKLKGVDFPEGRKGLLPVQEHDLLTNPVNKAAEIVREHLDLETIFSLATPSRPSEPPVLKRDKVFLEKSNLKPKIGFLYDSAFQFYYPENLEALKAEGADLLPLDSLKERRLPEVDALYIGGGFPETKAEDLFKNSLFREDIFKAVQRGLPLYAECGGLVYLGKSLSVSGKAYPMCGVFPLNFSFSERPQGHGYVEFEVCGENPFFAKGLKIKGHEFRYSKVDSVEGSVSMAFSMKRGVGIEAKKDGLVFKNVLASYAHIHALGCPEWAPALVEKARLFNKSTAKR